MEILDVKTIQERVKALHKTELYSVEYEVTLGENKNYGKSSYGNNEKR